MRVLLDECLPKRIKLILQDHALSTVPVDVFVTVDQNLQYQQNLQNYDIGIILIVVKNSRYETIRPLIQKVQQALQTTRAGQLVRIEAV